MTPVQASVLERWARQLGITLGAAAIDRLSAYAALLEVWNRSFRLTGERDTEAIVGKHFPDCLAVAAHVPRGARLVDVGSGAGFPGAVVACVLEEVRVVLLESRRRPSSFLRELVRTLPLPGACVDQERWEEWASRHPGGIDVVTGRAVPLQLLLGQAGVVLAAGGIVIGMQSQRTTARSLAEASKLFGFDLVEAHEYVLPSGEGRLLPVFSRR